MSSTNYIQVVFSIWTTSIIIIGSLINSFEKYLPAVISRSFRYGKMAYKEKCSMKTIEFPKSSFKQFYRVAFVWFGVFYFICYNTYILGNRVPDGVVWIIGLFSGGIKYPTTTATETFIVITLLTLQACRRFYDTHFVSVFGKNSKINVSHYIVGILYYPFVLFAVLCEAPNFTADNEFVETFKLSEIGPLDGLGIVLFLWSWWHQHVTTKILGNLRKKDEKEDKKDSYKLPKGDWFEYLSSPHSNAEILMYISLTLILCNNITWWFVLIWVISNQVETMVLSHWWYQETFHDFPKNRKAVIPFVY